VSGPENLRDYYFRYNAYGELTKVLLPSRQPSSTDPQQAFNAGYEYRWGSGFGSGSGEHLKLVEGEPPAYGIYRRVLERRVSNYGELEQRALYPLPVESSESGIPSRIVTVEHYDPETSLLAAASKEVHYFYGVPNADLLPTQYSPYLFGREFRSDVRTASDGVVQVRQMNWSQRADSDAPAGVPLARVGWWTNVAYPPHNEPANDTRLSWVYTTIDGTTSAESYQYDWFNNATEIREYGVGPYGNYAPSPFRVTTRTYESRSQYIGVPPDSGSASAHLRNLLKSEVVSGNAGQTLIEYDQDVRPLVPFPNVSPSSVSGLDTSTVTAHRGNAARISRGVGAEQVAENLSYDPAGNVVLMQDARGFATHIGFEDRFDRAGDAEAQANDAPPELGGYKTFAFPTRVTNALNQTTYSQYEYHVGKPVALEDANGIVTALAYENDMGRLTEVLRGANQPEAIQARALNRYGADSIGQNDMTVKSFRDRDGLRFDDYRTLVQYDTLGREAVRLAYEKAHCAFAVETHYDWRGRASWRTSPHREEVTPGACSPEAGEFNEDFATLYTYDALGRLLTSKTRRLLPQGSGQYDPTSYLTNISYSGRAETITDPQQRVKVIRRDSVGRVASVVEDPSVLNYETVYIYNNRDQLKTVAQGSQPQRNFEYDSLGRLQSATNPESGTTVYTAYDGNGNLLQWTDARNVTVTQTFDPLNRIKTRTFSDGTPPVTWTYDVVATPLSGFPVGRLSSVSNAVSTSQYEYDALGRVTAKRQVTDGRAYATRYTYNKLDQPTGIEYPSGRVLESTIGDVSPTANGYFHDRVMRVDFGGQVLASDFAYTPQGAVKSMKLGNNLWETSDFNPQLHQLTLLGLGDAPGNTSKWRLSYDYVANGNANHNNGNVITQTLTFPTGTGTQSLTQGHAYDGANRLASTWECLGATLCVPPNHIWAQVFQYDRWGNGRVSGGLFADSTLNPPSFDTNSNRVTGWLYDPAGNLTGNLTNGTIQYDALNRQTSFKKTPLSLAPTVYGYDGEGHRVRKVSPTGAVTVFVYDASGRLIAEYGGEAGGGTQYLTQDLLGSVRVATNATGSVVFRRDYLPFGGMIPSDQGGRLESGSGYTGSSGTTIHFTGKERDEESGLDYFGARYLSAAQGRFTSPDPAFEFGRSIHDPQMWNRYAYVRNNPFKFVDPDGRSPKLITGAIRLGVAAYKGYDLYSTVSGVVDSSRTIFSLNATVGTADRLKATGSLVLELSGINDIKAGFKAVKGGAKAIDGAGDAAKVDKILVVDPAKHPKAVQHLEDSGSLNRPLPVNREASPSNRDDALSGVPTKQGYDRDEAPPAMFRNPGDPVSVDYVPCGDNRGCGASLGNQARDVPDGGTVVIVKQE
jgi:RHS repeat-associated protein